MSRIIGIIAEDVSDIEVVTTLISKYVARNSFSVKKFVGNGCGKIKQKCDSWTDNLIRSGCQHVLIFHDLDRNDEKKLLAQLRKKVPAEKYSCTAIIIPIEELEAWLLSDKEAIAKAFQLNNAPNEIHNVEAIPSPKEYLARLIWDLAKKRYLNTVHNRKISDHLLLKNLRKCSSYKNFDDYMMNSVCSAKERNSLHRNV
jgi:hypothetical protein